MLKKTLWRLIVAAFGLALGAAYGQDGGSPHVAEDYQADAASADAGPVRMARVSYIEGTVTWRQDSTSDWSPASLNLPIREGAQISVSDHARAEIQFDDGSYARLGGVKRSEGGVITLQSLYSDAKGEFTEVVLNSGLMSLHLTNDKSLYQVDTESLSVKGYGPGKFRVGQGTGVEIIDRGGELSVQNTAGDSQTMESGQSLYETDGDAPFQTAGLPEADHWDRFVDSREDAVSAPVENVPENIAVCAGDLGSSGVWHSGEYGKTWYPKVATDWQPYHAGHWVFVRPFGWTWCADESWGWAPYHYGTWVRTSYGWGWCPGPAQQCWSPAVVHFSVYNGRTAWCPLAPSEVRYGNLARTPSPYFSIGTVGCYYPTAGRVCEPQCFRNVQANRIGAIVDLATINALYANGTGRTLGFIPLNSRLNGGSVVASNDFGRGVRNENLSEGSIFLHGHGYSGEGGRLLSGPPGVRVTVESFTPTHLYGGFAPASSLFEKKVVRQRLPSSIEGARPVQAPLNSVPPARPVIPPDFRPLDVKPRVVPPLQLGTWVIHPPAPEKVKTDYKNPPIYHAPLPVHVPIRPPVRPKTVVNSTPPAKKDNKTNHH